jgi:7-carboxy-7-deazaguanine synthase
MAQHRLDAGDPQAVSRRLALLGEPRRGELLVHEIYRSLQGESTFVGRPCVLVRLSVCDARCRWCDTPHAFHQGEWLATATIVDRVASLATRLVLVTGGEPLLQPEVLPLMTRLVDHGHEVLIETSGAHDVAAIDRRVHVIMDVKCPDSGEADHNRLDNFAALKASDQLKFVIASRGDFEWALGTIDDHGLDRRFEVLVSPAWGLVEPHSLAQWLLDSGRELRMQLQAHKYIWGPDTRGV